MQVDALQEEVRKLQVLQKDLETKLTLLEGQVSWLCVCVCMCVCVSISRNLAQEHICVQPAYTQVYGLVRAHIHMRCMHIMMGSVAFTHPGQVVIGYAATAARPSATAPAACAVSVAWRIAGLLLHAS